MSNSEKIYDFVIIGSGVAGLTCGIILAKEGHSVLILEKNHQVGGALQVFSRDKRIFDTGVHYLGGMEKGENLHSIFRYLGILDHVNFAKMDENGFDQIGFADGYTGRIGMGYERFREGLVNDFPEEEQAIDRFIAKVHATIEKYPLYNLRDENNYDVKANEHLTIELAWDVMESLFSSQRLIHVILGNAMIYAGDLKRTPFYVVALVLNSYIKGSYRVPGGGGLLTKAFVKQLRLFGGELQKHKEVKSLTIDDNLVEIVHCTDGSSYRCKNVISNLHPSMTVSLAGEQHFKPAYRHRLEKLKNTVSSFSVFITLEKGKVPYMNFNRYELYTENPFDSIDYSKSEWPKYLMVSTASHGVDQTFADSISILTYMDAKEVEPWLDTFNTVPFPSERSASYQQWKKEREELILKRFYERYPAVKEHVIDTYTSTPLTYRDYLGTPEGELYGIEKNVNLVASSSMNTRTKVSNLYLTGQNIVLHGILGSCIGALLTTFNFVNRAELLKKINQDGEL